MFKMKQQINYNYDSQNSKITRFIIVLVILLIGSGIYYW